MTNQEAIRILNLERDEWDISHCTPLERRAAFNLAIEALKSQDDSKESSLTHKALDTISRQAAIDALHMHLMYRMGTDSNKKRLDEWINNLPSAQPEDCDTCKHGYFGDDQCERCRVRYPSHYERRTDETN